MPPAAFDNFWESLSVLKSCLSPHYLKFSLVFFPDSFTFDKMLLVNSPSLSQFLFIVRQKQKNNNTLIIQTCILVCFLHYILIDLIWYNTGVVVVMKDFFSPSPTSKQRSLLNGAGIHWICTMVRFTMLEYEIFWVLWAVCVEVMGRVYLSSIAQTSLIPSCRWRLCNVLLICVLMRVRLLTGSLRRRQRCWWWWWRLLGFPSSRLSVWELSSMREITTTGQQQQ